MAGSGVALTLFDVDMKMRKVKTIKNCAHWPAFFSLPFLVKNTKATAARRSSTLGKMTWIIAESR